MVSLDQVNRIKEYQDSPTNSPNGKKGYESLVKSLITTNNSVLTSGSASCQTEALDKNSGGLTDVDAGYASPLALSVQDDDDITRACTPESQRSRDSGCEDNMPGTTDLLDNEMDMNPDEFAPFIPPPLGDNSFFTNSMEIGSMDETIGDDDLMWSNESWEIYDTDADLRVKNTADVKRNLSTPKFYPPVDELPILNSSEVEMSTPVTNLPLLQGNEIWFALDQGREITV